MEGEMCLTIAETGRKICFERAESNEYGTDYVRVTQDSQEIAYWSQDEWRDEPEFVMGAIMGALCGATRE